MLICGEGNFADLANYVACWPVAAGRNTRLEVGYRVQCRRCKPSAEKTHRRRQSPKRSQVYFIGYQPFRALVFKRNCCKGIFQMHNPLSVVAKVALIIAGTAAAFAFITFSPILFCQGGGAGGNCGEGLLASLPLALLLTPVILVFGIIVFFPSTKKVLLSVLVIGIALMAAPTIAGHIVAAAVRSYTKSHPTKAMQDHAVGSYSYCLDATARNRAQFSWDQPSAIESSSLEKCARERNALFDDFQIDAGVVASLEHDFQSNLPLLIETQRRRFPNQLPKKGN